MYYLDVYLVCTHGNQDKWPIDNTSLDSIMSVDSVVSCIVDDMISIFTQSLDMI